MKKIIFCVLFTFGTAVAALAQSDSRNTNTQSVSNTPAKRSSRHRSGVASTSIKPSLTETTPAKINSSTMVIPDNRTEYMQNGQLATYTGHQAAPINSDEFQSKKGRKKNTDRTRD